MFQKMSSKRGGRSSTVATNGDSSSKGKNASESLPKVEQLSHDVNLQSGEDDGEWVVYSRKSKNRAKSSAAKPWSPPVSGYDGGVGRASGSATGTGTGNGNPWHSKNANFRRTAEGNARTQLNASKSDSSNVISSTLIRPPLEHGWNWQSRSGSMQQRGDDSMVKDEIREESPVKNDGVDEEGEEGFDAMEDTDEDLMSDDYDSDASQKSHETRKKNKWFKVFFENFDSLTIDKINEPERQWHCPACRGGPGAIDWYRGLQPLITHAKTKGSKRVKIHREFAELLDEELLRRGTAVIPPGEVFGMWKGLKDEDKDHEIVWPPMVVVQNTRLEQDENDKVLFLC